MKPLIKVKPPGPKARHIITRDSRVVSNSLARAYGLVIAKAYGVNYEDVDGNIFLDFNSGIAVTNLGHSQGPIREAVKTQVDVGCHGAFLDFYSELPLRFSEDLVKRMPKGLNKVFLSNSGTESIEAAMKLARSHTKRKLFLAFQGSFHGRTYGSLSLTSSKIIYKEGFGPFLPAIHVPYAYCYRCPFAGDAAECCLGTLDFIEENVFKKEAAGEEFAAMFVEPVQGEGGYVVPPKEFIIGLRKICDDHGIVYVDDEVQAGCFRTGKFLAIENFGVKPDVVCLSKALGGGLPLGATVFREEFNTWRPGSHASTFGGNLVACAAGIASLKIMKKKGFGDDVQRKGRYMMKRLREIEADSPYVGDVRGLGLMIGLELVKDKKSKKPGKEEREKVIKRCFENGLALLGAGESTIRIAPPLIIEKADIDAGLDILAQSIRKL